MSIPFGVLPGAWHVAAAVPWLAALAWAARGAPWRALQEEGRLHVFLGACVALMVLWTVRAGGLVGLEYHYLGATLLVLMFRWRLALIGINLVIAASALAGNGDWQSLPLDGLVLGLWPVAVAYALLRAAERWLPRHLFVYLFVAAFFGGALSLAAAVVLASLALWIGGGYAFAELAAELYPWLPLLMFPEAFITGMVVTLLVVFRPRWVLTFDDARYLKGR